jgi:hypothetical protein
LRPDDQINDQDSKPGEDERDHPVDFYRRARQHQRIVHHRIKTSAGNHRTAKDAHPGEGAANQMTDTQKDPGLAGFDRQKPNGG